ncbi:MAG: hypothetical protein FJ263_10045 [Planctomycetes bacterium]|nr:hypothetical protein [Planctomycetota bacterium]
MKSKLFSTGQYTDIEKKIKLFLNQQQSFLSGTTAKSPRAVGDAIQDILAEHFDTIVGKDTICNYSSVFARRAMADLAFEDVAGCYYRVDVKTHRLSTQFNMPNLTSVERLSKFYEDDKNYFVILMVVYDLENIAVKVDKVHFVPIEFLDWSCLTMGALGWGQIQIANSNRICVNSKITRKQWMLTFCDILLDHFYPGEIQKIDERIKRFKQVRKFWENHSD